MKTNANTRQRLALDTEALAVQNQPMKCEVCGNEIEDLGPRKQRRYHDACKRWRNFLDAAIRAAQEMDPRPTADGARFIRQETFRASNRMAAITQPRDRLGRFC